jgi:hypothetical protein
MNKKKRLEKRLTKIDIKAITSTINYLGYCLQFYDSDIQLELSRSITNLTLVIKEELKNEKRK